MTCLLNMPNFYLFGYNLAKIQLTSYQIDVLDFALIIIKKLLNKQNLKIFHFSFFQIIWSGGHFVEFLLDIL